MRVSTLDQHPETQRHDLHEMARQRGCQIVQEYPDRISGAKARRPGLDALMRDARRGHFDVVLVWACDRIARSTKHFLEVLDELNRLNIEFISFREQIDTGGPLGRAVVVIIGAIAELERSLIVERVRAGMRRAKLEGRHIGRKALELDRAAILRDRQQGHSLGQLAKSHRVSRTTIHRVLGEQIPAVTKGVENPPPKPHGISSGSTRSVCSTTCGLRNSWQAHFEALQSANSSSYRTSLEISSIEKGGMLPTPVKRSDITS
jgi:DNA invertase Pin-like site-specific DNA recombinase